MQTTDMLFLLAMADVALLGYVYLRQSRRFRTERIVRSLRGFVLQQAS